LWGILVFLLLLGGAWGVRGESGVWTILAGLGFFSLALLGLGVHRGRRAERLGRGETIVVGGETRARAVAGEVTRSPDGRWQFSYRIGQRTCAETYPHRPPETAGDLGLAAIQGDRASWIRPSWRNRFLADAEVLFDAGPQKRKVLFLLALSLLSAVGACLWGLDLSRTWGLRAADGGALKPLWARMLLGGGLATAGVLGALMMGAYAFRYVSLIRKTGGDLLELRTILGRRRSLARTDLGKGPFHEGRLDTFSWIGVWPVRAILVLAPWRALYVRGDAIPFLLDGQGAVSDDL
jgi:hypothetical protein